MDTPYINNRKSYLEYGREQLKSGKWDDLKLKDAGFNVDAVIGQMMEQSYKPPQSTTQKEVLANLGLDQLSPEELKELGIELEE